ncbi:MAG: metallophosphoesterase [Gemmatimonadaceae bacterium]
MRFLHCSDLHITQDYLHAPKLRLGWRRWLAMFELTFGGRASGYRDARKTLRAIAADLDRHGAEHLLISGDLTAYSTDTEFRDALTALGSVATSRDTCSVIPGNHDRFTSHAVRDRRFEKYFGHLMETDLPEYRLASGFPFVHLKGEEAAVVGLSSAQLRFPGFAQGTVGREQRDALAKIIADPRMAERAVIVMVHHAPLRRSGRPDSAFHGLTDGVELLDLLPGPRFALVHGHLHDRFHHPATASRPHVFCAGSSSLRSREGYWVIDVADGVVTGGAIHAPNGPASR